MIIINVKDGESLDKALKRFKKKFEKTGVLRELRSRQAYEKKSVTRRHVVKHAIYKQNMNLEPNCLILIERIFSFCDRYIKTICTFNIPDGQIVFMFQERFIQLY